jgi:hypothetical protein
MIFVVKQGGTEASISPKNFAFVLSIINPVLLKNHLQTPTAMSDISNHATRYYSL